MKYIADIQIFLSDLHIFLKELVDIVLRKDQSIFRLRWSFHNSHTLSSWLCINIDDWDVGHSKDL